MPDTDFKRVKAYASSAIALLDRMRIPPIPRFYELLYTYSAGIYPALNGRINALLTKDAAPDIRTLEQLYADYLGQVDVSERVSDVSAQMSARIDAVHSAIDTAMATANSYSGSLQAASGDLDSELSQDGVRQLAKHLLSETRRMQTMNRQLESQLENSKNDIAALQQNLAEVRRESRLDPLTRLFNRKTFDDGLKRAIESAQASGEPLALILLDIDHFKVFNDSYGHQTGDQVLRLVAKTLRMNIKGQDFAARYGGEEFAGVLPRTDVKGAISLAENIRAAIQSKEILKRSTNEKLGRITASFGIAIYRPSESQDSFVERADRCLYSAKNSGRNRVVAEGPGPSRTSAA